MSFSREGMTVVVVVVVVVVEVNYPRNHKILLTEQHHQPLHHCAQPSAVHHQPPLQCNATTPDLYDSTPKSAVGGLWFACKSTL